MVGMLFSIYRRSPFWLRNVFACFVRPLRLFMRPFKTIKINGYCMVLDFSDNASFKYLTDKGKYEYTEVSAFLNAIKHNDGAFVMDIGAHYGAFTLAAASLGPQKCKNIIAFEPDRRPYNALFRSIRKNNFEDRVTLFRRMIGDIAKKETLYVNHRSSADNRTHCISTSPIKVREQYEVECTTVDKTCQQLNIPYDSRFIIKLDIQGNEPRAFEGMAGVLDKSEGFVLFFEYAPFLIRSAGLNVEDFSKAVSKMEVDKVFEINNEKLIPLDGTAGLIKKFKELEQSVETKMEGACTDYVLIKNMVF